MRWVSVCAVLIALTVLRVVSFHDDAIHPEHGSQCVVCAHTLTVPLPAPAVGAGVDDPPVRGYAREVRPIWNLSVRAFSRHTRAPPA